MIKDKKYNNVLKQSIIILPVILIIEVLQASTHTGAFDVDDIILNCLGGFIGFLAFVGLSAIKKHLPKILQRDLVYNILTVLLILLIIFYGLNWWGFI